MARGSTSHRTALPKGSGGGLDRRWSMRHGLGTAHRTFAAAISRRAMTTSRLSATMSGLAPFASCRARFEASITSSKRLETLPKQSSTVILAIAITVVGAVIEYKKNLKTVRDQIESNLLLFSPQIALRALKGLNKL